MRCLVSVPVPDPAVAHFGAEGMRRFPLSRAHISTVPSSVQKVLATVGVPVHVIPYFEAPDAHESVPLGVFAGHRGGPRPLTEQEEWLRIGTDRLAHLCVRPDGAVQAVFLGTGEADMFASTSVTTFNASLAVLDRQQAVIAAAPDLPAAAAAFRELNTELREIDPSAFEARESWWPRVLDDVRHTLNFPFSAAFEYVDAAGEKQIATEATGPGRAHPEELVWRSLASRGVAPEQVRRVYCELEACMMPGHYCAVWMQQTFPGAEFTHSFDYGMDAESRETGLKELITAAAQQARRQ
ncbi:nucleic acid/nucleotide deaminase domain-containing protein [Streptomyces sp. NPDC004111]|uniref:nucleic acid/nucleotide deaminase domain-containing protein n=1 Tax=Streptomyces sp. NPDC004111 TaxID=3364690 RepID=UPI0036B714CB